MELQCHVFVEGRRKNLMSRCSNSSPRYSVRTTMPSLLILKISYVFNNKISITLLSFLICLGKDYLQSNAKIIKSFGNTLLPNDFLHERADRAKSLFSCHYLSLFRHRRRFCGTQNLYLFPGHVQMSAIVWRATGTLFPVRITFPTPFLATLSLQDRK